MQCRTCLLRCFCIRSKLFCVCFRNALLLDLLQCLLANQVGGTTMEGTNDDPSALGLAFAVVVFVVVVFVVVVVCCGLLWFVVVCCGLSWLL